MIKGMNIGGLITKIGAARASVNEELTTTGAISNAIRAHLNGFGFFFNGVIGKPVAVKLSTWSRLGGWACRSSARVVQMGMASWPLRKVAPILASAAEAMTLERI